MQETYEMQVRSPGWKDSLEEGMAPYSSILSRRIPWTGEPRASQRVRHDWASELRPSYMSAEKLIITSTAKTTSLELSHRLQNTFTSKMKEGSTTKSRHSSRFCIFDLELYQGSTNHSPWANFTACMKSFASQISILIGHSHPNSRNIS